MSSKSQRPLSWLWQQFQLKPGKPSIAAFLQTLVLVLVPIGIGVLLGHPAEAAIAVMGAWMVGLVNVEGVYRQRATAKIAAALAITAMLLLANLVHGILWLSTLTTFGVMLIVGLASLYGQAAASIGLVMSIMFIVALAKFATFANLSAVLEQCALCLAGGIWAIVVSLGLWVLRPYAPVLESVANCYQALNQLVISAGERAANPEDLQEWTNRFLQAQDNFTQALAGARSVWSAVWTSQRTANLRGNQLLVLMEDTSQITSSIVALVEQLSISSNHLLFQQLQPEIQQAIEQLSCTLQQMSKAITKANVSVHLEALNRALEALEYRWQTIRAQLHNQSVAVEPEEYTQVISLGKIGAIVKRLTEQVYSDAKLTASLQKGDGRSIVNPVVSQTRPSALSSILEPLKDNLTFDSVLYRHALRLAIVATIAELIASTLHISTGYWITLTAVVALKPNYGGTSQSILQRVLGTVLGGMIGIAIVILIHNSWVITGCLLLLIFTAVAVQSLSYSLFITLLTPAIILLLNVTSNGGWQIGVIRIVDSLAGGLLALLGSYLLFPQWERQQLPAQLEKTIRANLAYFEQVMADYIDSNQDASADSIAKERRQAALENANANAAAQRLFSEPRHIQGDVEPIATLILYLRAFFNSIVTLAEHRRELSGEYRCQELKQFANTIVGVMENLADALQQQQPLRPLPDLDSYLEAIRTRVEQLHVQRASELASANRRVTPTLQAILQGTPIFTQLDRIASEIASLHNAIVRWRSHLR
ncbi:FUSC family protein [Planktothrix sp. FACHB-1355]|uniref:FUSC family protein n=1 Tax=Aerosakkonema funiforme FACHB-1375 TaxID=2949571 RepID=A0A926ZF09_9CYAN|nr:MULTISPECIES: FUSC family protein [Oscillatoriales]MBD2180638.1 FUSC family protein [Aerosakkonema funiforme FACHB-1375]MBD3557592.1 FUSC family protein [Planktothrix sp. FACHB-1355]